MLTKEQVIENYRRVAEISKAYMHECINEDKGILRNATDAEVRERAISDLCSFCYNYEERSNKLDVKGVDAMYMDMVKITDALSKAFKCKWISDTEFVVESNHQYLSDFAIMISTWFNVTSTSGFTFSSGLTTHNGKTLNDLYLDITYTDDGSWLLVFKGLTPQLPYWVSKDFAKNYKTK